MELEDMVSNKPVVLRPGAAGGRIENSEEQRARSRHEGFLAGTVLVRVWTHGRR
jgi:hypothetical protein